MMVNEQLNNYELLACPRCESEPQVSICRESGDPRLHNIKIFVNCLGCGYHMFTKKEVDAVEKVIFTATGRSHFLHIKSNNFLSEIVKGINNLCTEWNTKDRTT